jgi:hypothetical protein
MIRWILVNLRIETICQGASGMSETIDKKKLSEVIKRLIIVEKKIDTTVKEIYDEKEVLIRELSELIGFYNPIKTSIGTFEVVVRKGGYSPYKIVDCKMTKMDEEKCGKKSNAVPAFTKEEAAEIIEAIRKSS